MVLAPLLGGFILLFLSLILRSAAGCFRISAALAFLAGIAFGFAILVRLPVLFLLPGISLLLFGTTRRTCINTGLIAFCLGFAFGGVFPLLWHQHEVAGAWYLATYGSDDNSSPSLAVLEQNSLFYLWGGPGSHYNWALWVSSIGFVGLTITTHRSAAPVSWMRTLMAAALIWGTWTAYFLTHKIAIPYYQIPAMFAVLVLLALSGLTRQVLHDKPQEAWRRYSIKSFVERHDEAGGGDGIPSRTSCALEIAWAAQPQSTDFRLM